MQRVPVETTDSSYDVVIDSGGLERAAEYIRPIVSDRRIFIIADEGAWRSQHARLVKGLGRPELHAFELPGRRRQEAPG